MREEHSSQKKGGNDERTETSINSRSFAIMRLEEELTRLRGHLEKIEIVLFRLQLKYGTTKEEYLLKYMERVRIEIEETKRAIDAKIQEIEDGYERLSVQAEDESTTVRTNINQMYVESCCHDDGSDEVDDLFGDHGRLDNLFDN